MSWAIEAVGIKNKKPIAAAAIENQMDGSKRTRADLSIDDSSGCKDGWCLAKVAVYATG